MAVISTKAIVISSLKYSDTSLIVKLFTEEKGILSFMLKGILTSKKGKFRTAYFLPLTQVNIVANVKQNRNLHHIQDVSIYNHYNTLSTDIVKQSIAIFLSEILSNSIQEEESNPVLFHFLENSFLWLDTHSKVSSFHLYFLLRLSKFLGFYPDVSMIDSQGFNLVEGNFTNYTIDHHIIKGNDLISFKRLLGTNFDRLEEVSLTKKERKELLKILTKYFELHLEGFRNPKSLSVLEAVFST